VGLVSLLFGFSGRINRAQYWLGSLGAGFGLAFIVVMLMALGGMPSPAMTDEQKFAHLVSMFGMALLPAVLVGSWCGLALQWKRLHDRGRSGVWVFLPVLPSFMMVSSVFGAIAGGAHPAAIAAAAQPWGTILWIIQLGFLIDLGFLPGKPGPNKYGDPPGGTSTRAPGSPATPAKGAAQPIPRMSMLAGAESAMERAIAECAQQAAVAAAAPRAAAPTGGPRSAASGSFGRKVVQ
jgi:uncharacterized membrane protein YhaH (DUF805 family)